MLKDITYAGEYLSGKQEARKELNNNHGLIDIWGICNKYLPKGYRIVGWDDIGKELEDFTSIVSAKVDEALRYPITRKEKQTIPRIVDINVQTLKKKVSAMWRTLDEIRSNLNLDEEIASGELDHLLPNFIEEESTLLEFDDLTPTPIPTWKRPKDKK